MNTSVTRRSFTAGLGLLALGASSEALPGVAGNPPARAPDLTLPENNLHALVRMTASLRERDVPWWYDGTILGGVAGRASQATRQIPGYGTLLDASLAGRCLRADRQHPDFFPRCRHRCAAVRVQKPLCRGHQSGPAGRAGWRGRPWLQLLGERPSLQPHDRPAIVSVQRRNIRPC